MKIFAGKAAASYTQAKLIIKLAIDVARAVNSDPTVRGLLKVVFLPNYNVSLAETIIPAVDLSEQISTAGMEASGTGNMKMALNGALTVGTLDGANVELKDLVGDDNIFIFGLTAHEVEASRAKGIDSTRYIDASPVLRDVLDAVGSGVFSADDRGRYHGLVETLRHHDYFMVCADFDAYWTTQQKIDAAWRDRKAWLRSSIMNTANTGWFSSDRTIAEYADEIWKAPYKRLMPEKEGNVGESWRADEADIDALAAARHRDPFVVHGAASDAARAGRSAPSRPTRFRSQAVTRDGTPLVELERRKDDFFEGLLPKGAERPRYRLEVTRTRGVSSYEDAYAFGPALGTARRSSDARRHASRALQAARRADHDARGRRRRAVRALGAQREPRLRRRRFQRMGRPALPDAQALRQRPVGDLHPASRRRDRLQIRGRLGERRVAAAEGRPVRLRGGAAALDRLHRRLHQRLLLDRRRLHEGARARASGGASRCRSTRPSRLLAARRGRALAHL